MTPAEAQKAALSLSLTPSPETAAALNAKLTWLNLVNEWPERKEEVREHLRIVGYALGWGGLPGGDGK